MEISEIKHHLDAINLRLQTAEYQNRVAKIMLYRVMTNNYQPITNELGDKIENASIDFGDNDIRLVGKNLELIARIEVVSIKPINPEEGD